MSIFDLRVGTCGCCAPPAPTTPEPIVNRPALDAVAYRTGTWASFRQSMIDLIPVLADELAVEEGLAVRPLDRWTSRSRDDHGIALIEMWATLADVLTFYQERYANRAWLRTAQDHDAVRRLAALLGYRLKPGVAASTHLVVIVEEGVTLTVPGGLRAQSVPAEGERPQIFQTDAAVVAGSALNRVRVYGEPLTVTPLAAERVGETLAATSVVPLPGDQVVLCSDGEGDVEHRTVAATDVVDDRPVVRWSRPLGHANAHAFLRARTHRVFGHSAPETWLLPAVGASSDEVVTWSLEDTEHTFDDATVVHLDGTVEGIEAGSQVLIVADGVAHLRTVVSAAPATPTVGPLTGAATAVAFDEPAITYDVRTTVVHEVSAELTFQDWELPYAPLPAGTTTIHVPHPQVDAVADGRALVLDDEDGDPVLTSADGDAVPSGPGDEPEFLRIDLATPTTRDLDHRSAVLLGNVAPASHGEAVTGEVLGDGAAAVPLQQFSLAKAPVTHVTDPTAPGGARNTLEILVDGVRWSQRPSLLGAARDERIYVTEIDDDATMTVRFGDGVTGARLPTGRGNVVAGYRMGLGVDGNIDAGRITTALDRPAGLHAVHNPLPSAGGVDPESTAGARENAPNTVRTFDRAVSLADFGDLAREYAGVAKALATWVWDGEERAVHLTVGGEDGASLDAALADLRAYLDLRRDPNRTLRLGGFRPVPFVVALQVEADPAHRNDDVAAAVTTAIERYFAYDERAFGQAVHLSDLYHVVHTVEGVISALVTALDYRDAGDRATHPAPPAPTRGPLGGSVVRPPPLGPIDVSLPLPWLPTVLLHAPIAVARHDRTSGQILPAELAVLEAADLTVTAAGGIVS